MGKIELLKDALTYMENHPEQEITTEDVARNCYCSRSTLEKLFRCVNHISVHDYLVRRQTRYSELYPRLLGPLENGDAYMKGRNNVDISELYDLFSERKNCFFVCCDIKNLHPVNEISRRAGDLAILETLRRLNDAAGAQDMVFRIGGDEFALLTNREDRSYAEEIARKLLSENGTGFEYEGKQFPLSLHVSIVEPEARTVKYDELFTRLHTAIRDCK